MNAVVGILFILLGIIYFIQLIGVYTCLFSPFHNDLYDSKLGFLYWHVPIIPVIGLVIRNIMELD